MAVSEVQIEVLLETLEMLLKQIQPLRVRVDEIEKGLAQTQREYEQRLSQANAEADRLEAARLSVLARLNREAAPPPAPLPPIIEPTPPAPIVDLESEPGLLSPAPPPESPRAKRKRTLLDYIFNFTDTGPVIEKINALVDDDRRDMGEMLELLAWGEIWKARTNWETLDEQWQRLDQWRAALEQRVTYWTNEKKHLEDDQRYGLWDRKSELSENQWKDFLDELFRRQEADNARLSNEVAKLEERLRAQQAATLEVNDG
jgi:hypothetical protein